MERNFQMQLGGKTLTVETGKYAEQAGGSCLVRLGDTAVLVCATIAKTARDGVDFLPHLLESRRSRILLFLTHGAEL